MNAVIPADHVFWSLIDAPGVKSGPLPAGLSSHLEEQVPILAELLWAVGCSLPDGRLLICAVRRSSLESLDPSARTAAPDRLPPFFTQLEADPKLLNLLVGEFEPAVIRRARRLRRFRVAAAMFLCAMLLSIGLHRRARAWQDEARNADAISNSVLASLTPATTDQLIPSRRWTEDDLSLELANAANRTVPVPTRDAALALSALLGQWPSKVQGKPQAIIVNGDSTAFSVLVPGDGSEFVSAFHPPDGWVMDQPRLSAIDKSMRLSFELRRAAP